MSRIAELLAALRATPQVGDAIRHEATLPARPALIEPRAPEGYQRLLARLAERGVRALYSHQARALERLEAGENVVLATPTASGKTLVYTLPVLRSLARDPKARALYLFPIKALEQDQRKRLEADLAALGLAEAIRVAVYDGDTPARERRRLRSDPPHVLITTPDMLHAGLLPHHPAWRPLFAELRFVVLDELHVYRGLFGAHTAQVLRRLLRVARYHGSDPRLVAASATIANPGELARALTGEAFRVIQADGAPRPRRHVVLVNPQISPYTAAARIFRLAVGMGLKTIAFTKARRITELIHTWVCEAEPSLRDRISSYRAGFLPEERREIERRLFQGELVGVISTSALELGIDVGGLDVCLLVGYPGSQIATWQRAGRVGRIREGLLVLVAQPDALDQYLVAHPDVFLAQRFEHAVVDPHNPEIERAHLPCAAAELPLRAREPWLQQEATRGRVSELERAGELLRSEDGIRWFAARARPQRDIDLRRVGSAYRIEEQARPGAKPRRIGTIGSGRVQAECHPGAIYLHRGRPYRVRELDFDGLRVRVEPASMPYFTRALAEKETEILALEGRRRRGALLLERGRLRVTTRITGYERRRIHGQELIDTRPLDLPPTSIETTGFWIRVPEALVEALRRRGNHPMGSLHACEHAALSLFPLFTLCDRFDVGGITTLAHPQLRGPAIFLYDGVPGGAGLAAGVFERAESLLSATLELVKGCGCESGCPACVHSPRCGNGNRPIDKEGAVRALEGLLGEAPLAAPAGCARPALQEHAPEPPAPTRARADARLVFLDVETQKSAAEVGGWDNAHRMRLALAVVYDTAAERYTTYRERDAEALLAHLERADLVVGFNVLRFDYAVLGAYAPRPLDRLPTFDLLEAIHSRLGFRVSLAHLAEETLGTRKLADGLQALAWWREGRLEEIERYCRRDVELLRRLFEHALERGHLIFRTRDGERVRIPMGWSLGELLERARSGAEPAQWTVRRRRIRPSRSSK